MFPFNRIGAKSIRDGNVFGIPIHLFDSSQLFTYASTFSLHNLLHVPAITNSLCVMILH